MPCAVPKLVHRRQPAVLCLLGCSAVLTDQPVDDPLALDPDRDLEFVGVDDDLVRGKRGEFARACCPVQQADRLAAFSILTPMTPSTLRSRSRAKWLRVPAEITSIGKQPGNDTNNDHEHRRGDHDHQRQPAHDAAVSQENHAAAQPTARPKKPSSSAATSNAFDRLADQIMARVPPRTIRFYVLITTLKTPSPVSLGRSASPPAVRLCGT